MPSQKYIMVRLRIETHEDLNAMRTSLIDAYEHGQAEADVELTAEGISLDGMIRRLIRHVLNDRRRMREAKRRAAARHRADRLHTT